MESGGTIQSTATLETVVDAVEQVLDQALEYPAHTAADAELVDFVIRSPRLRAKFDSLMSKVTVAADRAEVATTLELRKTDQIVGAETGADPAVTRADIRLGSWLNDFTEFEAAFAAGAITREHLEFVRKGCDDQRTHGLLVRDQGFFIEQADALDFRRFKVAAAYWMHAADPDGEEPQDQVVNTRLRIVRRPDGSVALSGVFDPLLGTALINAVEEEDQKLFRQDTDNDDSRSAPKRRADALMGLVARGHDNGGSGIPRALINIVMSQTVAEQLLEQADNPLADIRLDPDSIDGRCEFIDGTPVHPTFALATLGVATLRRHVLDAKGRALDVSLNARSFPQWMRDVAMIESRGRCCEPGCDAPFHWLQIDHIKPHTKDGPTRPDNGQSLCAPGNRYKSDTWTEPDIPGTHEAQADIA